MLHSLKEGTCSPLFECFFATREQLQDAIDKKRSCIQAQEKREKQAAVHKEWKEFLKQKYSAKES